MMYVLTDPKLLAQAEAITKREPPSRERDARLRAIQQVKETRRPAPCRYS